MREGVRAQRCSSGRGRWCTSAADADGGFKDRLFAVCDGEGEVVEPYLDRVVVSGETNLAAVDPAEAAVRAGGQQDFECL